MPQPYTDHNMARTVAVCICNKFRSDPRLSHMSKSDLANTIWTTSDDYGYERIIDRRWTESPSEAAIIWRLTEHGDQWTISAPGECDIHFGQQPLVKTSN